MDLTSSFVSPWLVLMLVALAGWGIGLLAAGARSPPVERHVFPVHLAAEGTVTPGDLYALRQSVGLAILRCQPELALAFSEAATPEDLWVQVESAGPAGGLVLNVAQPGREAVLPERLYIESTATGELAAAWLLLHWPGATTPRAALDLVSAKPTFDARLIEAAARSRLPNDDAAGADARRQSLRHLVHTWPAAASPADRLRIMELLFGALAEDAHTASTAARAYEALDLASELLRAHMAAGRTMEAAAAQHLIARIRLALGRAESEPTHLAAAREAISHALAHGPRGLTPANRAADLALLGEVELASSEHEPGTACLHRAAAASRQAAGLTPAGSPCLPGRLLGAVAALTAIGEREGAAGRLEEAIALARQASFLSPTEPAQAALAHSLLAFGELTGSRAHIEESAELVAVAPSLPSRIIRARALEARGRSMLDAPAIKQAVDAWRTIAEEAQGQLTLADRRQHASCGLMAARLSADPELIGEAVALARAVRAEPAPTAVAAALASALLGEALLCRARARAADLAGASEAEACFSEAIAWLGSEPLPQLKGRLETARRDARRYREHSGPLAGISPDEPHSGPAPAPHPHAGLPPAPGLDSIALALEASPATGEARRLAGARRLVLVRLDIRAEATSGLLAPRELDWLERIERAQGRC